MDFTHFIAGKDDDGRRLDKILRRFLQEDHLSVIYKSLRNGLIKVNGKKCEGNFRVSEGTDIQIANVLLQKNDTASDTREQNSPLKALHDFIIFKNDAILILNKPYDIPVQPSSSSHGNSLSELVQAEYEANHEKTSLSFRTGPLHRLDRKTTGLIAFSQNLEGARWFSEHIQSHAIQKVYIAILEGNLTEKQVWEERIEKSGVSNEQLAGSRAQRGKFHTVEVNSTNGKIAHTEVEPVSHGVFLGKDVTLACVLIKTGRTHQIRAQAAFHGFPLLGDTAYGSTQIDSKRFKQEFFLHAAELHFPHDNPLGLPETIKAPIGKEFLKIIENSHFSPYN
ncbi:MAG: RluA family pseudouridine synthase [Treponema sp.]|nr:RluA family pseudouridine synthase [Treponema sp.]